MDELEYRDFLMSKIKILYETVWEKKIKESTVHKWLGNFSEEEELMSLYLLSKFMYFGGFHLRELLKSLYRDFFKYPIVHEIRRANSNTKDVEFIEREFAIIKKKTKFLPLGNISESGSHLIYPLRQENQLETDFFISDGNLFQKDSSDKVSLKYPHLERYIFFDDFCGSGSQISKSKIFEDIDLLRQLKPTVFISCIFLFATDIGKQLLLKTDLFDSVDSVITFDNTFKVFDPESRVLADIDGHIKTDALRKFCETKGRSLMLPYWLERIDNFDEVLMEVESSKLGFKDGQLLIGFNHNVPDNTLPIIWYDEDNPVWFPIFPRFSKN